MPTTPSHDSRRNRWRTRLWLGGGLVFGLGLTIAVLWRLGVWSPFAPPQDVALETDLCLVAPATPYDPGAHGGSHRATRGALPGVRHVPGARARLGCADHL